MNTTYAEQNGIARNGFTRLFGTRLRRLMLVGALVLTASLLVAARPHSGVHAAAGFTGDISITQSAATSHYSNVTSKEVTASAQALLWEGGGTVDFGDGTRLDADLSFPCSSGSYQWNPCAFQPTTLSATHSYTAPGNYTITISYKTGCCVTYSTSGTVTVDPTYVDFTFNFKGSGSGSVSYYWLGMRYDTNLWGFDGSNGSGSCSVTCSLTLKAGTKVFFTAHPSAGSAFAGWADDIANLCPSGHSARACSVIYQITPPTSGSSWSLVVPQVYTSSGQSFSQNIYLTFNR